MNIENIEMSSWDSGVLEEIKRDHAPGPASPASTSTHSTIDDSNNRENDPTYVLSENHFNELLSSESESDADMPTQRNKKKRRKTKQSDNISKSNSNYSNVQKILKLKAKSGKVLRQNTLNFAPKNSVLSTSNRIQMASNFAPKNSVSSTSNHIQSASSGSNSNSKNHAPESTEVVISPPKWFQQFDKLITFEGPAENQNSTENQNNTENLEFKCNTCGHSIRCHTSSSGNIGRHLSSKHPEINRQVAVQKNLQLQPNLQDVLDHNILTQSQLDEAVQDVVLEGMFPFSIVQLPSMNRLVLGLQAHKPYNQKLKLRCRTQFVEKLQKRMDDYKEELITLFEKIKYFAATADCWKTLNKAFLGVTVHWLQEEKKGPDFEYVRKSKVLACIRLKDSITFAVIAGELNKLFSEYKILEKITNVTTDNGSNFVKAFRVFGDKDLTIHEVDSSDENSTDGDKIEIVELFPTICPANFVEDSEYWSLPPHIRCASHTLNLIMTVDMEKMFNEDTTLKMTFNNCFSKLKLLWNRQNSDPIHSAAIREAIGFSLKTPNATRWNSTFDAIDCILKLPTKCTGNKKFPSLLLQDILNKLLHAVKLIDGTNIKCQKFIAGDVDVLTEYYAITKPLAGALDILQRSAKNSDLGNLLPVLYSLKRTLSKYCVETTMKHCLSLAKGFQTYIDERFQNAFVNQQFIVASCIHPDYQFRFIKDDDELIKICKNAVLEFKSHCQCNSPTKSTEDCEDAKKSTATEIEDSFFDFPTHASNSNLNGSIDDSSASIETERNCISEYVASSLGKHNRSIFPKSDYTDCMKELYLQFNTGLSSSAAVERVFSIGGDILRKKRNRLSDKNFEGCLKLREKTKDKGSPSKSSKKIKK